MSRLPAKRSSTDPALLAPDLPEPSLLQPFESLRAWFGWGRARRELALARERIDCEATLIRAADAAGHRERLADIEAAGRHDARRLARAREALQATAADDDAIAAQLSLLIARMTDPGVTPAGREQAERLLLGCADALCDGVRTDRTLLQRLADACRSLPGGSAPARLGHER